MAAIADLPDLARRAAGGEEAARADLVRELQPLVVRTARLIVGSGSGAAEDAAQDALLDILRGLGSLRDPQAITAWACRIASRRALRVARRERLLGPLADRRISGVALPLDAEFLAVHDAFYALPARMRAVAILRLHFGFTEQEVASIVGSAVGTVKSQLSQARARLAAALEPNVEESR
jgi:RNA polymerase sigma factor (sigma-70 family)